MTDRPPRDDQDLDAAARLHELLRTGDLDPDRDDLDHSAADPHDPVEQPDHTDAPSPGADAGPRVPEAPLFALLTSIENQVTVEQIDRIWIFPPRRFEAGETAVVVVAAYPALDPDRRTVYAAHYTAPAEAAEPSLAVQEFGTAPTERVGRIVEDVVGRIKDETPAAPSATRIEGDPARWHQMRHDLAERHLDQTTRHPRLRGTTPTTPDPS